MNAVLLTAVIMVTCDPFVLRHDIGFLLSFSAVIGLQTLGSRFTEYFRCIPGSLSFRQTMAETTAAILATTPLVLYAFDSFPAAALIVNIMILPFIPVAMLFGTASLLIGSIHVGLGTVIAFVCAALLRSLTAIIGSAARLLPAIEMTAGAWVFVSWYGSLLLIWIALARAPDREIRIPARSRGPHITVEIHEGT